MNARNPYLPDQLQTDLNQLPKALRAHCERMSEVAEALAQRYGYDPEKAKATALMHDIARAMGPQELLDLVTLYGLELLPVEEEVPILIHGPLGATILRQKYGITDEEMLDAIACHTTGKREMGLLDRILFLADKLDPEKIAFRPELQEVKDLAERDLDQALLKYFDLQLAYLITQGLAIHPAMVEARNKILAEM